MLNAVFFSRFYALFVTTTRSYRTTVSERPGAPLSWEKYILVSHKAILISWRTCWHTHTDIGWVLACRRNPHEPRVERSEYWQHLEKMMMGLVWSNRVILEERDFLRFHHTLIPSNLSSLPFFSPISCATFLLSLRVFHHVLLQTKDTGKQASVAAYCQRKSSRQHVFFSICPEH